MINIKFYQDQDGYFKAEADDQYSLLSQYFESEIQGIPEVCRELLNHIQNIESGNNTEIVGIGNAIGLKITLNEVTLWDEFSETDKELTISLIDFKLILENCFSTIDKQ
ncbi:MAG: hypothetical protein DCE90_03935 [Pseudanabaena sp.]|nr:MAG: hypothetical protein DCE90_03935 [Pseudanabaena sp.]